MTTRTMKTDRSEATRDILLNDRTEKMSDETLFRYRLMQGVNHIVNTALEGKRSRSSWECVGIQYSEFVREIARAFDDMVVRAEQCRSDGNEPPIAVYDEFVGIAKFVLPALKSIVRQPSRQLTKVEVKLPAARAPGFTSKTMQWMSTRPGRTVAEKISPENKVKTTRTVFSVDTKENRETMYLYKHLHTIIASRLSKTKCDKCTDRVCEREWVGEMKKLLVTYSHLKTDELGAVKPEKQAFQNNKLMCDLNYKTIWDGVKKLTEIEENIEAEFDHVYQRLAQVFYWALVGQALGDRRAKIIDDYGRLRDENGMLSFVRAEDSESKTNADEIMFFDENAELEFALKFELDGALVKVFIYDDRSAELLLEVDLPQDPEEDDEAEHRK